MDYKDPEEIAGHRRDARIEITISEDKLEAAADFIPAVGGGMHLELEYAEKLFESRGIINGIEWDTVRETVLTCNTDKKIIAAIKIAEGQFPELEIPSHYEVIPELLTTQVPVEQGGRIDHKLTSPFIMVKKDRTLAQKYDFTPGVEGVGVTGEPVPFRKKEISSVTPGEGTYTDENNVVKAAFSGRFTIVRDVFSISQVLDIKGNVDYHTGHIIFPGDVTISGEIKSGFQVYAGGTLVCNETIEAADITAKKQIIAKLGIIGKDKGVVRAGESIQAKFIQNCEIKARKDVYVQDAILNAMVKTMGALSTGDHGKIIGGEIMAIQGVSAFQIGNEAYHHTYIQCGIDFVAQKELDKVKKKYLALYLKMQSIDELSKKKQSPRLEKVKEELTEHLDQMVNKMDELLEKIDKNEDAVIEVKDTIYPGTTLDICHIDFIIEEPMKHVRFKLDKSIGEIVPENI